MSTMSIIAIIVAVLIILWIIGTFNKLKRLKINITETWSGIDVQLKRKVNIIPNLVDVLKMQMSFEKEVLVELTKARSGLNSNDPAMAMAANDKLDHIMASIRATAEAYPNLGTNRSFQMLMTDIRDCEDKVSYARNRYNMGVTKYNMEIAVFPNNIIANMMGCSAEKMFEISTPPREIADNLRIGQL